MSVFLIHTMLLQIGKFQHKRFLGWTVSTKNGKLSLRISEFGPECHLELSNSARPNSIVSSGFRSQSRSSDQSVETKNQACPTSSQKTAETAEQKSSPERGETTSRYRRLNSTMIDLQVQRSELRHYFECEETSIKNQLLLHSNGLLAIAHELQVKYI